MENNNYWEYTMYDEEQERYMHKMTESYVAFIDILGFKNMVLEDIEQVVLTLRQIKGFCTYHYKLDANRRGEDGDELEGMPYVTMFSDSVIITVSADIWWLHDFVELIADLQFFLLTQGVLVRGGIDIGEVYHDKNYIFGNGVVRAYMIESKISKYPRIVISDRAMQVASEKLDKDFDNFLEFEMKMGYSSDEIYDAVDERFSYDMNDRVSKDKHGLYYLEYLIRGIQNFPDDRTREAKFEKIEYIINSGLMSKTDAVKEKYVWLNDYFNRVFNCRCESEEKRREEKDRINKEFEKEEMRLLEVFKKEPDLALAFGRK